MADDKRKDDDVIPTTVPVAVEGVIPKKHGLWVGDYGVDIDLDY